MYLYDCLTVTRSRSEAAAIIRGLKAYFNIRVEEIVTKFRGIVFEQTRGRIYIHNSALLSQLLHRCPLVSAFSVRTPLPQSISQRKDGSPEQQGAPDQEDHMTVAKYGQIVGTLFYLANTVRPDMAFSTSLLSRYMSNRSPKHRQCAVHVLKY